MYKILHANKSGSVSKSLCADEIQLLYGTVFITMSTEDFIHFTKELNKVMANETGALTVCFCKNKQMDLANEKEMQQFEELLNMSLLLLESELIVMSRE